MDESAARLVQREAAEALMNVGVSVPIKDIHLPLRKKPVRLRVSMRRPTLAGQMSIARLWLKMGVSHKDMQRFSKEDEMRFLAEHGKEISRMIAYTVCQGYFARKLLVGVTSWFIRNFVEYEYQLGAIDKFVSLMGTDPFMPIIKSAEMTNPMKLRLSQRKKGS